MGLGEKIRKLRKQKKMTLVELSKLTGVAQASLSRIETGIMKGTVESHQKISEALGINISELYEGLDSKLNEIEHKTSVAAKKDAIIKNNNVRIDLLTSQLGNRKLAPVLITVPINESITFESLERNTDKFLWLQSGDSVQVSLNNRNYDLRFNDSLYFDASYEHKITNTAATEIKVLVVTAPATL